MPRFKYTVKDAKGATVTNEADAYDKLHLIQQLQKQGFFILNIDEVTLLRQPKRLPSGASGKKKFGHKKIKLNDLLTFSRQLGTMLESGVTLLRSLEVINDQIESENFFIVLKKITTEVERGTSLSEAMAAHPKVFNQFWISLVEVGEATGTMPRVLQKLTFYLEQTAAFQSAIISAIIYPIILFFVCIGAIAFFALVVGPHFENVFKSMNVQLPLITRSLLGIFRFIRENFILLIFIAIGAFFVFRQWAKTKAGTLQIEHFLLSLPTFGHIYRLIIVERFASQMSILVESGVPILHALDITQRLVSNLTCAKVVNDIKESVRQGELLALPMQRSGFFPQMAIQMISVGEETGELSRMLKHVANFYQSTVETFMKRLGVAIEPIMLVFMGVIIGFIVVAMFLPMFNLPQLLKGGSGG